MLESLRNLGSPAQDILGWRQLSSIAEVPEPFAERILEATTIRGNSGPSGRLRLEHMEPRMRERSHVSVTQGTAHRSTSNHRDVSHSGHRHRRSRGKHTDSLKAPSRQGNGVLGEPADTPAHESSHEASHR
jgi:hypothetical protein